MMDLNAFISWILRVLVRVVSFLVLAFQAARDHVVDVVRGDAFVRKLTVYDDGAVSTEYDCGNSLALVLMYACGVRSPTEIDVYVPAGATVVLSVQRHGGRSVWVAMRVSRDITARQCLRYFDDVATQRDPRVVVVNDVNVTATYDDMVCLDVLDVSQTVAVLRAIGRTDVKKSREEDRLWIMHLLTGEETVYTANRAVM